ncbi:MAG: S41 family peptidase [Planctomycetaceae bacterium]|nr:S41 family peptidase [Planctomycetaceae bacterium]
MIQIAILATESLSAQSGNVPFTSVSGTVTTPEIRSNITNVQRENLIEKNSAPVSFQPSLEDFRVTPAPTPVTTPFLTKNPLAKNHTETTLTSSTSTINEKTDTEPPKILRQFSGNASFPRPIVPIGSYYQEHDSNAANIAPSLNPNSALENATSDLHTPIIYNASSNTAFQEKINEVLQQGKILETEERWNEALALYENAIRTFHKPSILMERFRFARFHHDLIRRYSDASFDMLLRQLTYEDSLTLYDEVITKIQMAHVDPPYWNEMFEHGLRDFEVALATPVFVQRNIPKNIDTARMHSLSQMIVKKALTWDIQNARMLRYGVVTIAKSCQQEIGINPTVVILEFLSGITNALDPYTEFMTLNQYNDTNCMISGNFVGLGVELKADRESLYINRVIPGSPAEKSGLKSFERILYVDGKATEGLPLETASNLLQGEAGTSTILIVQASNSQPREIRIYREHLKIPSVENVHILNEYAKEMNIGYFKLTGFQQNTVQEMVVALQLLQQQGMQFLIIDLRDNAGGVFRESINAANLFLRDGTIVRTISRTAPEPEMVYSVTPKNFVWDMPLIVLINKNSASASEIFAGAIRDNKRGLIIGQPSFGKDTVQAVVALYGNKSEIPIAGLKLSIETFYSPSGAPFGGIGVQPDIFVANNAAQQGMNVQPEILALNSTPDGTAYQVKRITNDSQPITPQISQTTDDLVLNEAIKEIRRQQQTIFSPKNPSLSTQPPSAVSSRYQPSVN